MISSNSRKIFGLAASSLMVGASLVMAGVPASAAAGDVTIKPTSGKAYGVFNDDAFDLTTVVNSITGPDDATLSYKVTNPDKHGLIVDFGVAAALSLQLDGYKANGSPVDVISASAINITTSAVTRLDNSQDNGAFLVDFGDLNITTLVIHDIDFNGELTPTFQIVKDGNSSDDSAVLTGANLHDLQIDDSPTSALNQTRKGLGDGSGSITVQAWVDVNTDVTDVDAAYASAVETITFNDPNNVSVITRIQQMTATGPAGESISTSTIARTDYLMADSGATVGGLAASVKFNVSMNYAQIDLGDFKLGVDGVDGGTAFSATSAVVDEKTYSEGSAVTLADQGDLTRLTASNGKSADKNGELLVFAWSGKQFDAGDKFQLTFQHSDTTSAGAAASIYKSPQFTVVSNTVATTVDGGEITVAPTANANEATSTTAKLRTGTNAFTYNLQTQASSTDVTTANVPVVAKVQAATFLPATEELTVSGTTTKVDQGGEAAYVTGLTDSDGEFEVTVTAAEAAAGTQYIVTFYVADGTSNGSYSAAITTTNTYEAAAGSTFDVDNNVISAAEPTLTFSLVDVFGEAISETAAGVAYSVELKAANTDDLELYGQLVDGEVALSFTNFLEAGESEVLTAKLYKGTSTSPASTAYTGDQKNVTLYAPTAASAVNLSTDEITGAVVEFNDFITGKKVGSVGPTSGTNSKTVQGTVVDSNGAGIPGTPVTLAADGVQFLSGTTFSIGSVDLVTDAAGSFSAEVWVQSKSSTGITVTAASGSLSDTLLIKSDLPVDETGVTTDALNRGNLVFEVDMPSAVVVNTTYAVTASVKDVFGNPVDGAVVKFDGFGSAQWNGVASVTKTTNRNGEAVAYLRSIKDVDGLSAIEVSLTSVDHNADSNVDTESIASPITTDVANTSWDESAWSNLYEAEVNFLTSAPTGSADVKVNAGSFKGYVAVYAKGYEGQRLSAKIGNDWVVVPSLASNFERVVDLTGAGVDIAVRIYIDRVLMDTINLTTK